MTKRTKPQERRFLRATVLATTRVSPGFQRVTFGGRDLSALAPLGYDQWFRFFLPGPDGRLHLPTTTNNLWYAQYLLMPKSTRPVGRNYTVRAHRARGASGGPEIDVDFALHTDQGGALGHSAAWALAAEPGDEAGLLDEGLIYQRPAGTRWQLLVGDETALPAFLRILADGPRELRSEVIVEVGHPGDAQDPGDLPNTRVRWLARSEGAPGALATLATTPLPDGPGYAFVAGGQKLAAAVRRHLVGERGMAKESVTFTGYWR